MDGNGYFTMLCSAAVFHDFSADEIKNLVPELKPELKRYYMGETIARLSTQVERIGIVESGTVTAQYESYNGNVYSLRVYEKGEIFGLTAFGSSVGTWPCSMVVTDPGYVLTFSMRPFMADSKNTDVLYKQYRVWRSLSRKVSDDWNKMKIRDIARAAPTVRGKILTFLELMQLKYRSDTFDIRMSRDELAEFLNVDRSSIYRNLDALTKEGMVEVKNIRIFTIKKNIK